MAEKHILYIFDEHDWATRIHVANTARDNGHEVHLGLLSDRDEGDIESSFDVSVLPRAGKGLASLEAFRVIAAIRKLVKKQNPDIVHVVTLKYAFLTGLALLFLGSIKRVYTLAGLGYLFRAEGFKPRCLRALLSVPLKIVLRSKHAKIIFQNPDDQQILIENGYVKESQTCVILGSGVDLEKFQATSLKEIETPLVLMPTRLVHGKGISVFIQAAALLKERGAQADFQIAGGETRHNPEAISKDEMEEMLKDSTVKWLGRVEDMPALLQKADLIVYPSYYGEGVPRVLLEAAASGRTIITTDHPGCREAIQNERSGFLVPIKDAAATADAIETLLNDSGRLQAMGKAGREFAEAQFNILDVAKNTAALYGQF